MSEARPRGPEQVEIDGAHGEGGGQLLRLAAVLSLATGRPFHMRSIRANRPQPGLKPQHLHVLKALRWLSRCEVAGASAGSTEVWFKPGPVAGKDFTVDVGTAGSIPLMLQALLPAASLAKEPSAMALTGGTDVRWSMSFDFLAEVLLPEMPGAALELRRRGFYPAGGGSVLARVSPRPPARLALSGPARWERVRVLSVATADLAKARVAERQAEAALRELRGLAPAEAEAGYVDALCTGSVATAVAYGEAGRRAGADALGERGRRAEEVGRAAAAALAAELRSGAPVDRHAADNLVLWLALGGGELEVSELTEHTRTAIWLCELFAGPLFRVEGRVIAVERPLPLRPER